MNDAFYWISNEKIMMHKVDIPAVEARLQALDSPPHIFAATADGVPVKIVAYVGCECESL